MSCDIVTVLEWPKSEGKTTWCCETPGHSEIIWEEGSTKPELCPVAKARKEAREELGEAVLALVKAEAQLHGGGVAADLLIAIRELEL